MIHEIVKPIQECGRENLMQHNTSVNIIYLIFYM